MPSLVWILLVLLLLGALPAYPYSTSWGYAGTNGSAALEDRGGSGKKAAQPEGPGFFCPLASSLSRHVAAAMLLARLLARGQNPSWRDPVLY